MYRIPVDGPLVHWTVRLPKPLLDRLKALAAARKQTVTTVVSDLLNKALMQEGG